MEVYLLWKFIFYGKLSNLFQSMNANTKSKQTFILHVLY